MKVIAVILLFGTALAQDMPQPEAGNPLVIVPEQMTAFCTYNTELMAKKQSAVEACNKAIEDYMEKNSSEEEEEDEDRDTCDIASVVKAMAMAWEAKSCVYSLMGWLSPEMEMTEESMAVMQADLAALPEPLGPGLADTFPMCMSQAMNATLESVFAVQQNRDGSSEEGSSSGSGSGSGSSSGSGSNSGSEEADAGCGPTEDEREVMEDIIQKLTFFKCAQANFLTGCGNYILGLLENAVRQRS